jgi:hypothetical protein
MFGYVDALQRVGVRTVLICISARVVAPSPSLTRLRAPRSAYYLFWITASFDANAQTLRPIEASIRRGPRYGPAVSPALLRGRALSPRR